MKKRIKIQGFLIFLAVIAVILYAGYLLAPLRPLEWLWDILGLVLICWGYLLRICSRGYKAELNPDGKTLVTGGPYALTRNPMYLGTLCIGLGVTLVLFQWWVALVFITVYLAIYLPQIDREEARLSDAFGDKFKDYCRSTAKFFPLPARLFNAGNCLRLKTTWVKKELFSLLPTLVFVAGLKIWLLLKWR